MQYQHYKTLKIKMNKSELKKALINSKHIIVESVGEYEFEVLKERTIDEFVKLKKNAPVFRQSINRQNFYYAVFGLALYKTMTGSMNYDYEKSLELLKGIINKTARNSIESSSTKKFFMARISKLHIITNLMKKQMISADESEGWIFRKADSNAFWSFDVCQCGLLDYLKANGCPEICKVFCDVDYIGAEYMTGLTFFRSKTLAEGDDVCNFRYMKEN